MNKGDDDSCEGPNAHGLPKNRFMLNKTESLHSLRTVRPSVPSETWPPEVFNAVADQLAEILVKDYLQTVTSTRDQAYTRAGLNRT
jgi:hypothetical protein